MDWTLFFTIVGLGVVLIALVAGMLNRAWGDFAQHAPKIEELEARLRQEARWSAPPPVAEADEPELPAGAPGEDMIPVSHPLLKQAISRAMVSGGTPAATYFVREGDAIYLAAYRIADPDQREQVTKLFRALHDADDQASIFELLQAIKRLGR
ncbi:MAG: hypothetical protein EI684_09655 [Candidatus Viridilinea halotolerans]|uniref:Uncharacterized protein n=1 Tax=Candidatus Viridilinea halotolerans TaxID=2491704 RepID=A0A426U0Y1_9CHLR|nr:MAG: hypothetical protein EI684_09655 [Candidatus Viridilinea halotolerans]